MVTGGTGFIGSYVVAELLAQGHRVTILARNPAKVSGFADHEDIDFVRGDLRCPAAIRQAVRGVDAVIHVALGWGDSAVGMAEADTLPSLLIFEESVRADVSQIIYTSSIAAFGDDRPVVTDETMPRPGDYYGATKAATEAYLLAVGQTTGVKVNVIRPGYTFGEPVVAGASIYTDTKLPGLVRAAKHGEPVDVTQDDGTQFIWAGDLARVYRAVLESPHTRRLYTAVSTNFTRWEDIAVMAMEHCGTTREIRRTDRGLNPSYGRNSIAAIADDFGLSFDSTDRLRQHVAWLADRS